jgi:hypothetical protein
MDIKTRLVNYYNSNPFIQKYIKGLNQSTGEIVLSYNGFTKNISIDELENIIDETAVISFLNNNTFLREEVKEEPISMVEPKVISSESDKETLNDIKILTEIKSKAGLDNLLKDFAVNESTGLIDINKAIDIVEKNTIDEVVKSIKEHYDFDLDLQNYDKTGKYIGNVNFSNASDDEKIASSFNNLKVYLEAASMYPDQVQITEEDINRKMKEYIDKVKVVLNPTKEEPKKVIPLAEDKIAPITSQNAGFADIFVLSIIVVVYAIIIVNLILKLV